MSFTSAVFLVLFLPICVIATKIAKEKYQNTIIFLFSLVFYSWCGIKFLLLLIATATIAYFAARLINRTSVVKYRRIILTVTLLLTLAPLLYYKYSYDFLEFILNSFNITAYDAIFDGKSLVLPLGISFYTFSIISYIMDVYWEKTTAQKNIMLIWLYVIFFPRVVQGPIMRYNEFEKQLHCREITISALDQGMQRFIIGMLKKVFFADQLANLVNYSFENIQGVGTIPAWLGIVGYLLQLYYDFSGYSDMAVGLGTMFGFKLPENFDHPYVSSSVAEYWRRWHSSLGNWFRDYMYMPIYRILLDRFGRRTNLLYVDLITLFIVWLTTGIWHGSGMQFILYGIWYFAFVFLERVRDYKVKKKMREKGLKKRPASIQKKVFDHIYTIFVVIIGQVLFRASNIDIAFTYIKKLFVFDQTDGWVFISQLSNSVILVLILGIVFCFPVAGNIRSKVFGQSNVLQIVYRFILAIAFFISFIYMASAGYQPFLYQVF